ncbi:MAG: dihydroorotase [Candidatus Berkiellales bacterium]
MKIIIKKGRVIDPANQVDKIADIAIENGKIIKIAEDIKNFTADQTIEAANLWVIPGLVDSCCRPQMLHPHGTTLVHEAKAALQRGITSLCVPPDGNPIVDEPASVMRLTKQGDETLPALYAYGALTSGLKGKTIADLTLLAEAGCVAFTNAQEPIKSLRMLRQCYDYAVSFNLLCIIQPQDPWLSDERVAHEGIQATLLGLPGIPESAETISIAQHLLLIEQSGVRAHFTCLSTKAGVQQIREAKAKGLPVTADTAMHSLHLTELDIGGFNANCHLYPPLRSEADRDGLRKGVNDGTIDAICSDHRPLESIAKLAPFGDTVPGMTAVDTYLALGLKLVVQKHLSLSDLILAISAKPAKIFNLPAGTLAEGALADICVIDPHQEWVVTEETLFSRGKNTPFMQQTLKGVVTHCLRHGQIVYEG